MKKSKNIKVLLGSLLFTSLFSVSVQAATHTVQSGDSLYKIGLKYNISYEEIINDNGLKSTMIYPGQKLYIRDTKEIKYTVKSGDSLYKIAKKYETTVQAIKSLNGLKSDEIYPGQVLKVKTSISTPTTPINPNQGQTSGSGVTYTDSELDLLSRLIQAEAGGESYNTQLAVGAVVLNRVKDKGFPSTIKNVIYEVSNGYYQFTPVLNGQINKPGSTSSLKAAKEALSGVDPTKGALYFFDNTITNQWLLSKPVALKEKNMTFAY